MNKKEKITLIVCTTIFLIIVFILFFGSGKLKTNMGIFLITIFIIIITAFVTFIITYKPKPPTPTPTTNFPVTIHNINPGMNAINLVFPKKSIIIPPDNIVYGLPMNLGMSFTGTSSSSLIPSNYQYSFSFTNPSMTDIYISPQGLFTIENVITNMYIDNTLNPSIPVTVYTKDMNGNIYPFYSLQGGQLLSKIVAYVNQSFSISPSFTNPININNTSDNYIVVNTGATTLSFSS